MIKIIHIFIYLLLNIILFLTNKKIKIDDDITHYIINNFGVFKYIAPNIITISGLIINFIIFNLLQTNNSNYYLVIFLILYRWLADCLDGAVARKYNKGSKIGHYLDTISDIIMAFITVYFIQKYFINLPFNFVLILYIFFIFIYNKTFNFITNHNNLKNTQKNNFIYNIVVFGTNNTIITYILLILTYLLTITNP